MFHQLDVADPSSAACLADFIKHKFGKLDILINNAGILGVTYQFDDDSDLDKQLEGKNANVTMEWWVQQTFFSGDELKEELNDVDKLSEERLDELAELFVDDFKNGELESRGWPAKGNGFVAYKASKVLLHAYTRVLARKHVPSLRVNCVHPGYVKTEMTRGTGDLTVEEGAAGPVTVALSPPGGATGVFFFRTEPASFV
ncbi:hypothetical protein ABZP36_031643 [Zizania latifolia]